MFLIRMFSPATVMDGFRDWPTAAYGWLLLAVAMITGISIYWGESLVGIVSAVTGVVCVVMVARAKIANYSFGVINAALYGYVAYQATYYGDAMLNWLFYLPIQFLGFYMWDQANRKVDSATVIRERMSMKAIVITASLAISAIAVYGALLESWGDAMPFVDSSTTVLSITAMILMLKRFAEQWILWIMVNVLSIGMWVVSTIANDGGGIAALMMWMVFLVNSVYGWISWSFSGPVQNSET